MIPAALLRKLRPMLGSESRVRRALKEASFAATRVRHSLAETFPSAGLIRPQPRQLTVAITASCNLRCVGCRYGRDFMPGKSLPWTVIDPLLEDARAAGVVRVRWYGGEPMLHPELPRAIRRCRELDLDPYVTTNGTLIGQRIEELFDAGLRFMTIGFYGTPEKSREYTQREGTFEKLSAGLEKARSLYGGAVEFQLNYVLIKPHCNLEALHDAWSFARRFDMHFHVDLYGYSIPFFTDGPNDELVFTEADRPAAVAVATELLRLQAEHPNRVPHAAEFLRSIPDWLLKGAAMRVPCDAYELLWVGADGSVQLCDVTFPLGNLHEKRLREMLFTSEHRKACTDAFELRCPNCTCKVDSRIRKHAESMRRYHAPAPANSA